MTLAKIVHTYISHVKVADFLKLVPQIRARFTYFKKMVLIFRLLFAVHRGTGMNRPHRGMQLSPLKIRTWQQSVFQQDLCLLSKCFSVTFTLWFAWVQSTQSNSVFTFFRAALKAWPMSDSKYSVVFFQYKGWGHSALQSQVTGEGGNHGHSSAGWQN